MVDTPPSRNALDFLEAPTRLTDYVGSRLLSLLSGGPSRFGFRAMNFAAAPFLRLADRLLGAEVLAEVSDFVQQLQLLYGGIQARARSVYRLLRSPQTGFVVVTTLEQGPFNEAEFFCTKLREFKMPLRAMVVNRVLPDVFRDTGGVAAATTLVEDPKVAAWLTDQLHTRVSADTARFIGRTFLQPPHSGAARVASAVEVDPARGGTRCAHTAVQRGGLRARGAGAHRQGTLTGAVLAGDVPTLSPDRRATASLRCGARANARHRSRRAQVDLRGAPQSNHPQ